MAQLPDEADVLVVGAGPAGLVLAAQLAAFGELRTVVVDAAEGPIEVGRADGVACRTVEMLEAFGLAGRLAEEAYRVNEVTFWRPDEAGTLTRTGRIPDVEDDLSEMPHLVLNQARLLAHLREYIGVPVRYGSAVEGVHRGDDDVVVTLTGGARVRARYVVGCDGARSAVRRAMGLRLVGDVMDQSWGVMDVLGVTDFPDIRLKSAIRSDAGAILVIPREGGHLVRLYIELDGSRPRDEITPATLAALANRILHPYTLEVRDVVWWTVYDVGQRLCDRFDDGAEHPRVFLAGDACHTHSAQAGQGMNVSMADAWNLGWKLAAVLRGTARPALLRTYSAERRAVAQELIDFDREFAARMTARDDDGGYGDYFARQGRYTAGLGVRYAPSMITAPAVSPVPGFAIGERFHSAPVVRLCDAQPMQLGHVARADGAWRIYVFAASPDHPVFAFLASLVARYTPDGAEPDAVIDVRAVFTAGHRTLDAVAMPPVLVPRTGRLGLVDLGKTFADDGLFARRGVDPEAGAVVVVRPDQYVALVVGLDDHDALARFVAGALIEGPQRGTA